MLQIGTAARLPDCQKTPDRKVIIFCLDIKLNARLDALPDRQLSRFHGAIDILPDWPDWHLPDWPDRQLRQIGQIDLARSAPDCLRVPSFNGL